VDIRPNASETSETSGDGRTTNLNLEFRRPSKARLGARKHLRTQRVISRMSYSVNFSSVHGNGTLHFSSYSGLSCHSKRYQKSWGVSLACREPIRLLIRQRESLQNVQQPWARVDSQRQERTQTGARGASLHMV